MAEARYDMNRRTALKALGIGATGMMASPFAWAQDTKRPNIVVILSDDQGFGDVSYHEHPKEVHMPNIGELSEKKDVLGNKKCLIQDEEIQSRFV